MTGPVETGQDRLRLDELQDHRHLQLSAQGSRPAYLYGLNSNGNLHCYAPNGAGYKAAGSVAGFRSFKTITTISKERTHHTLLMITKAGALYTIHIPTTVKAKPVVKVIRTGDWTAWSRWWSASAVSAAAART